MIPAFRMLPRLNPLKSENLLYLASSAVITRLTVAGIRVWENQPEKNNNPEYNKVDKFSTLWERIFIEIFGTVGYMITMHVAWDMMANLYERNLKLPLMETAGKIKSFVGMTEAESLDIAQKVNKALKEVYGESEKGVGLIDRAIFGPSPNKQATRKNLLNAFERLNIKNPEVIKEIMGELKASGTIENFISELNKKCTKTMIVGVLLGAIFGGVVIQYVNDRLFSPYFVPFVNKILGVSNKPRQIFYQNNPFSTNQTNAMSMGWTGNTSQHERTFKH